MIDKFDVLEVIKEELESYRESFGQKNYPVENENHDVVMDLFGITPSLKRENRQYWGRELGMCWQKIVISVCRAKCTSYKPAWKIGADEPFDLIVGGYAIDTKYRIGSGDAGTLKKFKQYGQLIKNLNFQPVLLVLREDSLAPAISACVTGGWTVYQGASTFSFLKDLTDINLDHALSDLRGFFQIERSQGTV
jgi:hypothetical protein